MEYTVPPGLFAVGSPSPESPVFVSANYKLSFDKLRSRLDGIDSWLLVLDTKGINVWCAAGKGTFGTDEIVNRLESCRLAEIVSHRRLIVPQLGAPGVSAHEVKRRSGFAVRYGPVRAEDIAAFLQAGMKATPEMRRVQFPFRDRIALIPVELVTWSWYVLAAAAVLLLLSGLGQGFYSFARILSVGLVNVVLLLAIFLAGASLTPALLPWLPGRAFSAKGAWIGLMFILLLQLGVRVNSAVFANPFGAAAWVFLAPAITSFVAMNFTGASTYTSLSGVLREMRFAVPIQIAVGTIGLGLWLVARFV
jgi:acetyl-CoA decarbonylase/synthase complex subunit gamma